MAEYLFPNGENEEALEWKKGNREIGEAAASWVNHQMGGEATIGGVNVHVARGISGFPGGLGSPQRSGVPRTVAIDGVVWEVGQERVDPLRYVQSCVCGHPGLLVWEKESEHVCGECGEALEEDLSLRINGSVRDVLLRTQGGLRILVHVYESFASLAPGQRVYGGGWMDVDSKGKVHVSTQSVEIAGAPGAPPGLFQGSDEEEVGVLDDPYLLETVPFFMAQFALAVSAVSSLAHVGGGVGGKRVHVLLACDEADDGPVHAVVHEMLELWDGVVLRAESARNGLYTKKGKSDGWTTLGLLPSLVGKIVYLPFVDALRDSEAIRIAQIMDDDQAGVEVPMCTTVWMTAFVAPRRGGSGGGDDDDEFVVTPVVLGAGSGSRTYGGGVGSSAGYGRGYGKGYGAHGGERERLRLGEKTTRRRVLPRTGVVIRVANPSGSERYTALLANGLTENVVAFGSGSFFTGPAASVATDTALSEAPIELGEEAHAVLGEYFRARRRLGSELGAGDLETLIQVSKGAGVLFGDVGPGGEGVVSEEAALAGIAVMEESVISLYGSRAALLTRWQGLDAGHCSLLEVYGGRTLRDKLRGMRKQMEVYRSVLL